MLADGGNAQVDVVLALLGVVIPRLAAHDRLLAQERAPGAYGDELDQVQ